MSEAEALPDFVPHLTGGIEELKTTSFGCSLLTFIKEEEQLSDLDIPQINSNDNHQNFSVDLILTTTHSSADFMTQISEINKQLNK